MTGVSVSGRVRNTSVRDGCGIDLVETGDDQIGLDRL
jgi:hypothetical protein